MKPLAILPCLSTFALLLTTLTTPLLAKSVARPITLKVDSKPNHVMLFKNGYGLVTSRAILEHAHNIKPEHFGRPITFQTNIFPNATQGSFWLSWNHNLNLTNIITTESTSQVAAKPNNLAEYLAALQGATIRLKLNDSTKTPQWVTAQILNIPRQDNPAPAPQPTPQPYYNYNQIPPLQNFNPQYHNTKTSVPTFSNLVTLRIDKKIRIININQIQEIELTGFNGIPDFHKTQTTPVLEFSTTLTPLDKRPMSGAIVLSEVQSTYLASGISWNPSYLIDITHLNDNDQKAHITAKAIIVNDLTDLDNISAELISGYPNIEYQSTTSAISQISLQRMLNQIISLSNYNASLNDRNRNHFGMMRQSLASNMAVAGNIMMDFATAPQMPTEGEMIDDLYFYKIKNVTLKKGQRGYFPLFKETIPAKTIYTWDVTNTFNPNQNYYYNNEPQPTITQTVWHSLELTNTTKQPWTTASAMTTKQHRILGQDTIKYTPVGGKSKLKITQAVSIKANDEETMKNRTRNAANFYNRHYDKLDMEGTLELTNYKDIPVTIEITKIVRGQEVSAERTPTITKLPVNYYHVNDNVQLKWTITLQPGKENTQKINYKYQTYVHQ